MPDINDMTEQEHTATDFLLKGGLILLRAQRSEAQQPWAGSDRLYIMIVCRLDAATVSTSLCPVGENVPLHLDDGMVHAVFFPDEDPRNAAVDALSEQYPEAVVDETDFSWDLEGLEV